MGVRAIIPYANQAKASFIDTGLTTSFADIWEATETRGLTGTPGTSPQTQWTKGKGEAVPEMRVLALDSASPANTRAITSSITDLR